jgi:hypothetical protein
MKAHVGQRRYSSTIFNFGTLDRGKWSALLPAREYVVPTGQEARWDILEAVEKKKVFPPSRIWYIRKGADKSLAFPISYLQHNQNNFSWMG